MKNHEYQVYQNAPGRGIRVSSTFLKYLVPAPYYTPANPLLVKYFFDISTRTVPNRPKRPNRCNLGKNGKYRGEWRKIEEIVDISRKIGSGLGRICGGLG